MLSHIYIYIYIHTYIHKYVYIYIYIYGYMDPCCKKPRSSDEVETLGGSWVVIGGVISPLIWVITIVTLLMTPLIATRTSKQASSRVAATLDGREAGLLLRFRV